MLVEPGLAAVRGEGAFHAGPLRHPQRIQADENASEAEDQPQDKASNGNAKVLRESM